MQLTIDNQPVAVPDGASVLDAARAAGIALPQLCKDKDQPIIGACRTCLVEIEGMRPFPASCHTPAREGMVVRTDVPEVARIRRGVLELTLGMVGRDSGGIATNGRSELDAALERHGVAERRWSVREHPPADTSNPFFVLNHGDCILCGRCTAACQDVQHIGAIAMVGRDGDTRVGTHMDRPILESICTSCGQCVSVCPTGAILPREGAGVREPAAGEMSIRDAAITPANPSPGPSPTRGGAPSSGQSAVDDGHAEQRSGSQETANEGAPPLAGEGPGERSDGEGTRSPLIPLSLELIAPSPPAARTVATTCPYCGVGCGVALNIGEDERIGWVDDQPANGSSRGMLCVKGRFGATYVHHGDRLTTPLIRRDGVLQPCSWDEALEYTADRLVEHRGAFASLASAKGTNEDGYAQQKFVRLLMGTNNIDHCTRLCHSPSVEAMLIQLGSGATSNSYEDYEAAGCLLVVGCDPSSNHPVIASRLRRAIDDNGAKLIVINPRRIDLCNYTDLWLRPFPGTDVALFNALAKVVLEEDLWDRAFVAARTEGFDEWFATVAKTDVAEAAQITGVKEDLIRRAARLYARPAGGNDERATMNDEVGTGGNSSFIVGRSSLRSGSCAIWGMGITQHTNGTANAHALLNFALLCGQMGTYGSGVSPLRGQNNVQGCGDAGCIPDSLPGYRGLSAESVAAFEELWGGPLPGEMGVKATDMIEQAVTGEIRAMYIVGENPLLSEPNLDHAREGIANLDFLVVQDIFLHETAALAHVVLPAAAFAEKEGTFTNSERRVQRVRKAIEPPGEARPDWEIVCDLAGRVAERLDRDPAAFAYPDAAAIFDEMARAWPNIAGLSHARLDREPERQRGGIQWPCPTADHPGTPRMYTESFPRGLGKFVPVEQAEQAAELPDRRFPLLLNTGRTLYHWHGATITRRVRGLMARAPEVRVAVNPLDAATYELADGDEVVVSSRRGEMTARVLITEAERQGEVFIPFTRLAESAANWLTNNVYDRTSRIPEYKVCAVRLDKPGQAGRWRRGRRRTPVG